MKFSKIMQFDYVFFFCNVLDVIGIIQKKENINNFNNKHGQPQKNIKFKISDGR